MVSNKAAESRIRDANVAEESANLTRYSVLTQSGIAALAQANNQSQSVLKLPRVSINNGGGKHRHEAGSPRRLFRHAGRAHLAAFSQGV